eukprot:1452756-Amphidinium_carterae.1
MLQSSAKKSFQQMMRRKMIMDESRPCMHMLQKECSDERSYNGGHAVDFDCFESTQLERVPEGQNTVKPGVL